MAQNPDRMTDAPALKLPEAAARIANDYPDLWEAYQTFGKAVGNVGPLDERTRRLVHLAYALGAGSPGSAHSHVRRGLLEGIAPDELEHVAILAATTLGWPRAVQGLLLVRDVTSPEQPSESDIAAEIADCIGF